MFLILHFPSHHLLRFETAVMANFKVLSYHSPTKSGIRRQISVTRSGIPAEIEPATSQIQVCAAAGSVPLFAGDRNVECSHSWNLQVTGALLCSALLCQSQDEEWNYLLVLCDSVRDAGLVFVNMIGRLISFVLLSCCLHYKRTISLSITCLHFLKKIFFSALLKFGNLRHDRDFSVISGL
jgi:hypothetical protein